jgi:exosortase
MGTHFSIATVMVSAGLLLVYAPAGRLLWHAWQLDPYSSHGFLIPLVSLALVWLERREVVLARGALDQARPAGLFFAGLTLYALATLADLRYAIYASFMVTLIGLVACWWGTRVLRRLWFPIFYLVFMFPLPYAISAAAAFPLQLISSKYAALMLELMGVSALQEGVNIHVPGFSFIIERGCSGLQSIMALLALSVLVAYLLRCSTGRRLFIVFAAVPTALAANLVRIVTVVLVAIIWGNDVAQSFFHSFSSVFLFSLAFLMLMGTARFIGCLTEKGC